MNLGLFIERKTLLNNKEQWRHQTTPPTTPSPAPISIQLHTFTCAWRDQDACALAPAGEASTWAPQQQTRLGSVSSGTRSDRSGRFSSGQPGRKGGEPPPRSRKEREDHGGTWTPDLPLKTRCTGPNRAEPRGESTQVCLVYMFAFHLFTASLVRNKNMKRQKRSLTWSWAPENWY